jgi:phospholipid/cholesterol/gamma-HCH transport system permease protein
MMNGLLCKTGALVFSTAALVSNISGMTYLTLKGVIYLGESGKRRIFFHLFKRYLYNSGVRAAYVNTLLAVLLGWVMIIITTRYLPTGTALSDYFQNFYVIVSIREIGPMVSGLILISRSANAATADVGYLKLNDEFEVLRGQRMSPFIIFLMPVFFAFPLSLLLMFFFFNVVCVLSSYIFLELASGAGIGLGMFISGLLMKISTLEILVSVAKAILGGSVIGVISIYFGSRVHGGYDSVSRAISNSTTAQIFAFLAINLLLSYVAYR